MNSKVFLLILGLLSHCSASLAMPAGSHFESLFEKGNEAYKAGAYDSAKACYAEIQNNGYASAALFFNMGNTFFKNGNIPAAILYYERAALLDPTDKDIRYNLEVANTYVPDKIDAVEPVFIDAWLESTSSILSPNGWVYLFWTMLVLLCISTLTFFIARQKTLRQIAFLCGVALLLTNAVVLWMAIKSKQIYEKPYAIVFTPSVNVKSEPALNATVQFVIHEGLKVEVVGEDDNWYRIALADGNTGWVPAQSIEPVQWSKK